MRKHRILSIVFSLEMPQTLNLIRQFIRLICHR